MPKKKPKEDLFKKWILLCEPSGNGWISWFDMSLVVVAEVVFCVYRSIPILFPLILKMFLIDKWEVEEGGVVPIGHSSLVFGRMFLSFCLLSIQGNILIGRPYMWTQFKLSRSLTLYVSQKKLNLPFTWMQPNSLFLYSQFYNSI